MVLLSLTTPLLRYDTCRKITFLENSEVIFQDNRLHARRKNKHFYEQIINTIVGTSCIGISNKNNFDTFLRMYE